MATLIWRAPLRYGSRGDEDAFFAWLNAIPAVVSVKGVGRELHIRLKSRRISRAALLELIALYSRYDGDLGELAQFETEANSQWFRRPDAYWHRDVFKVEAMPDR